jgi:hypothetical protein
MSTCVQCFACRHFIPTGKCMAFVNNIGMPGEIPIEIMTGEFVHTKPYPGDHGIRFEEIDPGSEIDEYPISTEDNTGE